MYGMEQEVAFEKLERSFAESAILPAEDFAQEAEDFDADDPLLIGS